VLVAVGVTLHGRQGILEMNEAAAVPAAAEAPNLDLSL
jgi:hypothetical protein